MRLVQEQWSNQILWNFGIRAVAAEDGPWLRPSTLKRSVGQTATNGSDGPKRVSHNSQHALQFPSYRVPSSTCRSWPLHAHQLTSGSHSIPMRQSWWSKSRSFCRMVCTNSIPWTLARGGGGNVLSSDASDASAKPPQDVQRASVTRIWRGWTGENYLLPRRLAIC
jgi:hypothetical protein